MVRLGVEQLESRLLAGGLQPTAPEQLFLELLNAARANPADYGTSIGLDLSGVAPSGPLAFNGNLIQAARGHSEDMRARDYFAHNTPEGLSPGERITATGYNWTAWSESIAAGFSTPATALAGLIIDEGVADLGHRRHLLAIDSIAASQLEVGIGIAMGGSGAWQNYYTIDTARDFFPSQTHDVYLTGVIYNDLDQDNFYSEGEGYTGVTIAAVGPVTVSTTSFQSGGYSLPLPAGTYQVTASGGSFAAQTSSVTVGASNNVKLDFLAAGSDPPPSSGDQLGTWNGSWRLDTNDNESWDGQAGGDTLVGAFGNRRTDVPVVIDWGSDGADDQAFFRRGRTLFIDANQDGVWTKGTDPRRRLGNGGDQAVVGDWNGDGNDQLGVFRNENSRFHLDTNGDRVLNNSDAQARFMRTLATDIAIAGDWNGDGRDEIGIFRLSRTNRALFLLDTNGNMRWDGPSVDTRVNLGRFPGAKPAVANYDSDSATELAVFSRGTFRIDSDSNGSVDRTVIFVGGRYPVPGQWT